MVMTNDDNNKNNKNNDNDNNKTFTISSKHIFNQVIKNLKRKDQDISKDNIFINENFFAKDLYSYENLKLIDDVNDTNMDDVQCLINILKHEVEELDKIN